MGKTESVLFKLGADVSGLTKGLAQGRAGLKDMEKGADGLASKLMGLAGILGVGIGFGAASAEALHFGDAVTNVAKQTGMSTDAVQRLAYFASQTGQTLEGVTGTVGKMQENLVKAADGTDKQAQAFKDLGINTEEFFRLEPDAQLMAVAQGLEDIHNPAMRASVAVAALGKSGKESIPMLLEMAERGDALNAQFEKMGGPMSAATIAALDDIGDSASTAGQGVRNFAGEILALAAPAIIGAMSGVTTFFAALRHGLTGGDNEMVNLDDQILAIENRLKDGRGAVDMYGVAMSMSTKEAAELTAQLSVLRAKYQELADGPPPPPPSLPPVAEELADIVVRGTAKAAVTLDMETKMWMASMALRQQMQDETEVMARNHEINLGDITKTGLTERQEFQIKSYGQQAETVFGELANITAGVAQHNRALFNINKVAGIANAIINMHTGITKSLSAYPMPLAGVMAAVHAAAGMAQVMAIKSASFNGGGAGAAPSNATQVPTPTTPAGGGSGGGGGGSVLQLQGISPEHMYSGKMVRFLAEQLVEHQKNGGTVVLSS